MNWRQSARLTGRVWRQMLVPFTGGLLALTGVMLVNQLLKQRHALLRYGASAADVVRVLVLSIPFIVSMTLPMAVLIAVLRAFMRRTERREVALLQLPDATSRRLVLAALAFGIVAGGVAFVWNDAVLPESNHQLRLLLLSVQHPSQVFIDPLPGQRGDREMSVAALHEVVMTARSDAERAVAAGDSARAHRARERAATYAVEIQKKYAIAASCVILALLGAGIGLRVRGGGWRLITVICWGVFGIEYTALIGGEELGDRLIISPFWAMWSANVLLGVIAIALVWSHVARPLLTASNSQTDGLHRKTAPPASSAC